MQESKKGGGRRHCKWCGKYKPDRCHHCRVCRTCILKMDHHCPWIYNCVGYHNYKYFFLLLFYCSLTLNYIVFNLIWTVQIAIATDIHFAEMFFVLFGETLATFFAILITGFWIFHIYLMVRAMSTIEFCEKSLPKSGEVKPWVGSPYDLGCYNNIKQCLGDNPLFWLLPFNPPSGDGLTYPTNEGKAQSAEGSTSRGKRPVQRRHYGAIGQGPDDGLGGAYFDPVNQ